MKLDDADFRILRILEEDGRIRNVDLAARSGMSESNCLRRVKALEAAGVITGYKAVIDPKLAGFNLAAYILVNLDQRAEADAKEVLKAASRDSRVISCEAITGGNDLILHVLVRDMADLSMLTLDNLLKLKSVKDLTTCVVLRSYTE